MGSFLFWGAVSGALAVMLGAFGAHGLKAKLDADMMGVYQTAVQYHFYHGLGLVLIGLLLLQVDHGAFRWSGTFMMAGIVLFSGSLYVLSVSGVKWLGAITPIGGVLWIIAWALLAWGAIQIGSSR